MNTPIDYERIVLLIYKRITGTIRTEESAELEAWRKATPENDAVYRKLTDIRFLEHEYRRLHIIDPTRPLEDMKARIRKASVFVVSGSLPDGTDPSLYKRTAEEVAREFGLVPLDDLLNRSAELAGK